MNNSIDSAVNQFKHAGFPKGKGVAGKNQPVGKAEISEETFKKELERMKEGEDLW